MAAEENLQVMQAVKTAVSLFALLAVVTGALYPLAVFASGEVMFPKQAHGSLFYAKDGMVAGSELIGQSYTSERYFQGRPSATAVKPYNPMTSGGSNLGPTNKVFVSGLVNRTEDLKEAYGIDAVPSDLVMSSASGLDPHVSVGSAMLQTGRIAKARGIPEENLKALVLRHVETPLFGFLGKERVNVVSLNRDLDGVI
jgi:potassium-transporting ATPase KdpC subunit